MGRWIRRKNRAGIDQEKQIKETFHYEKDPTQI